MVNEQPLIGWKEIAEYLRVPVRTIQARTQELKACGVLMERVMMPKGANGRRMPKHVRVWTWPSLLQRWTIQKGKL